MAAEGQKNWVKWIQKNAPSALTIKKVKGKPNTVRVTAVSPGSMRIGWRFVVVAGIPTIIVDGKRMCFSEKRPWTKRSTSTLEHIVECVQRGIGMIARCEAQGLKFTDPTEYQYSLDDKGHVLAIEKKWGAFVELE